MNQGEPVEIFPMALDISADENVTDFRPVPLPSSAPEEEVPNPKVESAPEPVNSPESTHPSEQNRTATPVPPTVGSADGSPKLPATGSQTS